MKRQLAFIALSFISCLTSFAEEPPLPNGDNPGRFVIVATGNDGTEAPRKFAQGSFTAGDPHSLALNPPTILLFRLDTVTGKVWMFVRQEWRNEKGEIKASFVWEDANMNGEQLRHQLGGQ